MTVIDVDEARRRVDRAIDVYAQAVGWVMGDEVTQVYVNARKRELADALDDFYLAAWEQGEACANGSGPIQMG
jgi:VanZ family protein